MTDTQMVVGVIDVIIVIGALTRRAAAPADPPSVTAFGNVVIIPSAMATIEVIADFCNRSARFIARSFIARASIFM